MRNLIISMILVIASVSCANEDVKYINLEQAKETEEGVLIKWTKPDITGFKYYQIMRADDGQSYSVINTISNPESDAYKIDVTTYIDKEYALEDSIYYKVIAIGDEIVSSKSVLVKIDKPFITNSTSMLMCPVFGADKLALAYYDNKLAIVDMNEKQTLKTTTLTNSYNVSSSDFLTSGMYNNEPEVVYYSNYNEKIYIFDANTLTTKSVLPYYYLSSPKLVMDKNGNIYGVSKSNSYIFSTNRSGLSKEYYTGSTIYDMKYDALQNTLEILCNATVIRYQLGNDGTLTLLENIGLPSNSFNSFIEKTNYLYRTENVRLALYDYKLKTYKGSNNNFYNNGIYIFNNNYLYLIPQGSSSKVIYCYDASTLNLVKTITAKGVIEKVCNDNNYLYIKIQYMYSNYTTIERKKLL